MNVLALGAHPDDIELGCGGFLIKAVREGHDVYMYTLTRGAVSGDPKQRTLELLQSGKFIGAKEVRIGDFQDTRLAADSELINSIESYINLVDPDLVLSPSNVDIHHDHRAIAAATVEAARFNSNLLSYEIPLTKAFEPKVFFDISDVIDEKVELIKIFRSQRSKLYLQPNAIRGLANYRALQSRLNTSMAYVEAFDVVKLCLDRELKLLKAPIDGKFLQASDDSEDDLELTRIVAVRDRDTE